LLKKEINEVIENNEINEELIKSIFIEKFEMKNKVDVK
jgi:hypothetical protein